MHVVAIRSIGIPLTSVKIAYVMHIIDEFFPPQVDVVSHGNI